MQEISEIKQILNKYSPQKENIIKAMHDIQNNNEHHYLSEQALDELSKYFKLTKGQIYGIASYYSMISLKPRGKYIVSICKSPVCTSKGGKKLFEYFEKQLNLKPKTTTDDGLISLEAVECLGRCGKCPSILINNQVYTEMNVEKLQQLLKNLK